MYTRLSTLIIKAKLRIWHNLRNVHLWHVQLLQFWGNNLLSIPVWICWVTKNCPPVFNRKLSEGMLLWLFVFACFTQLTTHHKYTIADYFPSIRFLIFKAFSFSFFNIATSFHLFLYLLSSSNVRMCYSSLFLYHCKLNISGLVGTKQAFWGSWKLWWPFFTNFWHFTD